MLDELVKFFVVLLVVVEPLSLLPILAGLTEGAGDAFRRRMSFKAAAISGTAQIVHNHLCAALCKFERMAFAQTIAGSGTLSTTALSSIFSSSSLGISTVI